MGGNKLIIFLFFMFGMVLTSKGQTVPYTYVDPCTGVLTTVDVPTTTGTVTMFYGGQYQTFTYAQLQSGAYDQWVSSINSQFPPGTDPCASLGGTVTNDFNNVMGSTTAGNIANITSIVQMASNIAVSTSGAANTAGGISSSVSGESDSDGDSTSDDEDDSESNSEGSTNTSTSSEGNTSTGGNSGSNSTTGSSTGSGNGSGSGTSTGSSDNGGGGNTGGSSGNGGGGNGGSSGGGNTGGSDGNTTPRVGTDESGNISSGEGDGDSDLLEEAQMGAMGSQTTTSASGGDSESSDSKQEKVGRGALIAAGDFVVIRNSSDIRQSGMDNLKFNTSITHLNSKQTFIKGANFNYQTGENLGNLTLYGSFKTEKNMFIFSNSTMSNFSSDIFNTTSVMDALKVKKVTLMGGTNYTFGQLGKGKFSNWSLIGGGFTNFKGGRYISSNVMLLGVYSPYIFYYEGQWYRSGLLFIPLVNNDIKITDTFKWSISFAGVYQYEGSVLNWQLSTGTKILL